MYSAYRLNNQGDNTQPWHTPFPIWNQSMSGTNCCFLMCIQISQEAGKVVWYSHLFKNFPLMKDWCWSWGSNTLATWCEELTYWKRPWCWERLKTGGEGDDSGWDGWMASLSRYTWVRGSSGSWWWTGKPGVLQSMGSQRVGHEWATELNWTDGTRYHDLSFLMLSFKPALSLSSFTFIKRFLFAFCHKGGIICVWPGCKAKHENFQTWDRMRGK